MLDAAGLTDEVLIEKYLKLLLKAKETKFFQHKGRVVSKRNVAALGIRTQALDLAFKLKGSYAPPKVDTTEVRTVSVIVLDIPRPRPPGTTGAPAPIEVRPVNGNKGNGMGDD